MFLTYFEIWIKINTKPSLCQLTSLHAVKFIAYCQRENVGWTKCLPWYQNFETSFIKKRWQTKLFFISLNTSCRYPKTKCKSMQHCKDENDIRSKVLLKFQTQHKFFQDKFLNIGKIPNILVLKNPTKYPKSEFL